MYDLEGSARELDALVMSYYDSTLRHIEGELEAKATNADKLFKAATAAVLALLAAAVVAIWRQLQTML